MITIATNICNGCYVRLFMLVNPKGQISFEVVGPTSSRIVDDQGSTFECNLRHARQLFADMVREQNMANGFIFC